MKNAVWIFICILFLSVGFSFCSKRHVASRSPVELQAQKEAERERQNEEAEKAQAKERERRYNMQSKKTKAMMKENERRARQNNISGKKECFLVRWFSFRKR
jgi:hypothetical protein